MTTYVAFLRGINVGGNKKVSMARLKVLFEKNGYRNVKTVLSSGNVIFDSKDSSNVSLPERLSHVIAKEFGFPVYVIVRTFDDLKHLVAKEPFKDIQATSNMRLYGTFLSHEVSKEVMSEVYHQAPFHMVLSYPDSVWYVVDISKVGSVDAMKTLESYFGKNITTRNWNTIQKIENVTSIT